MMYLDLGEIDCVLSLNRFWSRSAWAPARFKRSDFHGDPRVDIAEAVRATVARQLGWRPEGPIRVLANLRYFGFNINPLTTYYCFDKSGDHLQAILAEVTNTPWRERHAYAMACSGSKSLHRFEFDKRMHVSPFNPMDMQYRWAGNQPGRRLLTHIENWQNRELVMDATLKLTRRSIDTSSLAWLLIRFPFMTVKVFAAIYWQALKLWFKRVPFVPHAGPTKNTHRQAEESNQ